MPALGQGSYWPEWVTSRQHAQDLTTILTRDGILETDCRPARIMKLTSILTPHDILHHTTLTIIEGIMENRKHPYIVLWKTDKRVYLHSMIEDIFAVSTLLSASAFNFASTILFASKCSLLLSMKHIVVC